LIFYSNGNQDTEHTYKTKSKGGGNKNKITKKKITTKMEQNN